MGAPQRCLEECCAVLCCAVQCCAVRCCAVLCCAAARDADTVLLLFSDSHDEFD